MKKYKWWQHIYYFLKLPIFVSFLFLLIIGTISFIRLFPDHEDFVGFSILFFGMGIVSYIISMES